MARINADVFSEFSVTDQFIKFLKGESETFTDMSCVGTAEHELETRTVIKKCQGVVVKNTTKGTGNGTLTEKLHIPRTVYNKLFAMNQDGLKEGIKAYGTESRHPEFALTMLIENEDGDRMYRAYPRCKLTNGPKSVIENGAEEVAEVDLTIALLPDEYGNTVYDSLEKDLDSTIADKWLKEFKPEMVREVVA